MTLKLSWCLAMLAHHRGDPEMLRQALFALDLWRPKRYEYPLVDQRIDKLEFDLAAMEAQNANTVVEEVNAGAGEA